MNKLEKQVYDILKHNPRLKLFVRNIYQRIFDLLPTPQTESAYEIQVREGFFFGFHDHTPFSPDNTKMLAHRYNAPLRMPKPEDTVDIGYFEGDNLESFNYLTRSKAWSWHLGAKLQWLGPQNKVLFNDHIDNRNVSRIIDIESKEEWTLSDPVGSVSPDGNWAIGYSFSRVEKFMPGYGYPYPAEDPEENHPAPEKQGVYRIDLRSGNKETLFSIADIVKLNPEPTMKGASHFFSHTVFSPDSKRFIFLHRWVTDSIYKRYSRMLSSDINGENLYVFPTAGMVSHIGWKNPSQVIAYCRTYYKGDQYVLFKDHGDKPYEIIGEGKFNSDGHPSFDPSGRWIVTDSYPDRRKIQNLIVFDTIGKKRFDLARLPMPAKFRDRNIYHNCSCDLHPRWDRAGRKISFDATFTGTRSLCFIDLGLDLEKEAVKHLEGICKTRTHVSNGGK